MPGFFAATINTSMNKRKLHHLWRYIRAASVWYFLVLTIISGLVAVFALRNNNLTAVRLREKVLQVDKDNGDIEAALRELRSYTHSHMNSSLASTTSAYPPIQLKYRYERLMVAEQARIDAANKSNSVYVDAQEHCERTQPQSFSGSGRLNCIQQYIDSRPTAQIVSPKEIPDALYKFDFASPAWSPDLAGLSLLSSLFFGLLLLARLALGFWFGHQFKRHA